MNGEPSRRLLMISVGSKTYHGAHLLVQEYFAMLFALHAHLSEAHNAALVGLWTLQETTVSAYGVVNTILRGSVKFWRLLASLAACFGSKPTL